MRCPKCGNERNREEALCGQCGAPIVLPTRPPQTADAPAPRTGGLLRSYNTNVAPQASPYDTQPAPSADPNPAGTMPPQASAYNLRTAPPSQPPRPPVNGSRTGQPSSPTRTSNLHQPTGFYQDATEAMVVSPLNGNPNYPQNGFPAASPQRPAPTMYNPHMLPFQAGNHTSRAPARSTPTSLQTYPSGQGYNYGMPPNVTPPPKKRSNLFLIVVCIMFAFAFLIAAGVGGLYLLRNQSSQATTPASTSAPTATSIPSPTPSPTPISSPTPTPLPSPTLTPTPAPAPGFSYCDASCITNGYSVEYPSSWREGTTSDSTGVEFKNPQAHDEYAAFKATNPTGSGTANDLINNDLQNNFASQPDYTPSNSTQSTTIGGVTWVYSVATYTLNNQTERIEVFATVRQGKDYVIELQAADSQFDDVNNQYFVTMLGNFQFQSGS